MSGCKPARTVVQAVGVSAGTVFAEHGVARQPERRLTESQGAPGR